jgi:hypothetical protein
MSHDERMKNILRRVTDDQLMRIIAGLRSGSSEYPAAALGADDLERELQRRCADHLETFSLLR